MASTLTVAFSGAGTMAAGYPIDEHPVGSRFILKPTLANSEVLTVTHASDPNKARRIHVLNASTGALIADSVVAVVRASATQTTFTASGAGAGTYLILIEIM